MVEIVAERLSQDDCSGGFLLDGFTNCRPGRCFGDWLKSKDLKLDNVVYIDVPNDILVERQLDGGHAQSRDAPTM